MQCVHAFIGKTDKSNGKYGFLQDESGVWQTRSWSSRVCSVFYSKHKLTSSGRRRHDNVWLQKYRSQSPQCLGRIERKLWRHHHRQTWTFNGYLIHEPCHIWWQTLVTPRHPLLPGTKRAALLDKGMIQKADITLEDLRNANKVSLFNAMIDFGEIEIAIENVHF